MDNVNHGKHVYSWRFKQGAYDNQCLKRLVKFPASFVELGCITAYVSSKLYVLSKKVIQK